MASNGAYLVGGGGTESRYDRGWTELVTVPGVVSDSWSAPDGRLLATTNEYRVSYRNTLPGWFRRVVEIVGTSVRVLWSSPEPTNVTKISLDGVWSQSAEDIYAVGSGGFVLHFDGSSWAPMESGTTRDLHAVHGVGGAVFAAGDGGLILRLANGRWTPVESGTDATLRAIWGSSEGNVYAVGDRGTILRFDGRRWSSMSSGTTLRLNSVWGTAAGTVFATGEAGVILMGE
jgi:hypothetical protein